MTQVAQMFIGFERQSLERGDKRGLFRRRQDAGPIAKARHHGRARGCIVEQVDLR